MRRFPRSRRHPHFHTEVLAQAIGEGYGWFEDLGGRRRPAKETANTGWEVEAFRGYADWMATEAFGAAIAALQELAAAGPIAVMWAEAPWWRCHRLLVSDALVVRGWRVEHIGPDGRLTEHALTAFAEAEGEALTYPAPQLRLGDG